MKNPFKNIIFSTTLILFCILLFGVFSSGVLASLSLKSPTLEIKDYNRDGTIDIKDLVLALNPGIVKGDVNQDGKVDILDLAIIGKNYGKVKEKNSLLAKIAGKEKEWDENAERADLNRDGRVDIFDLAIFGKHFKNGFEKSGTAKVYVKPASIGKTVGETFDVDIMVDTSARLYAFQTEIHYDPTIIRAESVKEGEFLKRDGASTFVGGFCSDGGNELCPAIDNNNGIITFANSRWGVSKGLSGTGSLFTITFKALKKGKSVIEIVENKTQLVNDDNSAIETTLSNGQVEVKRINHPPSGPTSVQLRPTTAFKTTEFSCSASGSTDPDGDPITYEYRFLRGSSVVRDFSSNNKFTCSVCKKGDSVKCEARANDGITVSPAVSSNSVIILNAPPSTPTSVELSPLSGKKGTEFTCAASGSTDPDGDFISYYYEFRRTSDSQILQEFSSNNKYVCGDRCNKGDSIKCYSKSFDGEKFSGEAGSKAAGIVNSPPVLEPIGNKVAVEGKLLEFKLNYKDPDGDTITCTAKNLPSGAKLKNCVFSWSPGFEQQGSYEVVFEISDGEAKDQEKITITVKNQNRAPKIISYSPLRDEPSIGEKETQRFSVEAEDEDGDPLTIKWYINGEFVNEGNSYTFVSNKDSQGIYSVRVVVSDGLDSVEKTWTLKVIDTCTTIKLKAGNNIFSLPRRTGKSLVSFNELKGNCEIVVGGENSVCSGEDLAYYKPSIEPNRTNYVCINSDDWLYPGQGYFVKVRSDCELELCGGFIEPREIGFLGNNLKPGWNLIGSPSEEKIFNPGSCQLYGGVGPLKYAYNVHSCREVEGYNGGYAYCTVMNGVKRCRCEVSVLEPGEGYWLKTKNECRLA